MPPLKIKYPEMAFGSILESLLIIIISCIHFKSKFVKCIKIKLPLHGATLASYNNILYGYHVLRNFRGTKFSRMHGSLRE